MTSGPGMIPQGDREMKPRSSDEAQLERDYKARDSDRLAKAAARAQAKGTMR